jgi:hypothetical protein
VHFAFFLNSVYYYIIIFVCPDSERYLQLQQVDRCSESYFLSLINVGLSMNVCVAMYAFRGSVRSDLKNI